MPKYGYVNLCTIYSCEINGKSVISQPMRSVCYGSTLTKLTRVINNAVYNIVLIKDDSFVTNKNYNNRCFMSKHQLENYVRRISTIKPFKYKVYDSEYQGSPCYKVKIDIHGTKKEITFVLQCIKRAYEYPYNFFLHQAYKLQEIPEYKRDSILNLYNVAFSSFWSYQYTDHSFSGNAKFEKYETLREKLPHARSVIELYPDVGQATQYKPTLATPFSVTNGNMPSDSSQWDHEAFNELLPLYASNYKLLKR